MNIVSDLSQNGHVSRIARSTLKADVGLKGMDGEEDERV